MASLQRVTQFTDLRVGMKIIERPCRRCGQEHRFELTEKAFGDAFWDGKLVAPGMHGFIVSPDPHPPRPGLRTAITTRDVADGHVFILLEDDVDDAGPPPPAA